MSFKMTEEKFSRLFGKINLSEEEIICLRHYYNLPTEELPNEDRALVIARVALTKFDSLNNRAAKGIPAFDGCLI